MGACTEPAHIDPLDTSPAALLHHDHSTASPPPSRRGLQAVTNKKPPTGAFSAADLSDRFSWETRDCAVVSVRTACRISYEVAHALLKANGREDRQATFGKTLSAALGIRYQSRSRGPRPTAAQFIREKPEGRYIVFVTDHYFALVDGVQVDADPSLYRPRARLWGYWEIPADGAWQAPAAQSNA